MPKRPGSSKRRRSLLTPDVNLMPVMNLFMVLIPFLLFTAVFAKTAAIDIYLPQISEAGVGKDMGKSPGETLIVSVTKDGFTFGGIGKGLKPVLKKDDRFDFRLLTERLVELKRNYPDRQEIILLFEAATPYEFVIKMMDSTREAFVEEDGESIRKILFPLVSVGEHI